MKIAIHNNQGGFTPRWIAYCQANGIDYKLVNCYQSDIMAQLQDCDALMWHHYQTNPKDILFAKALLFSLQQVGIKVFPDFKTNWHFDDKLGQKYLLEALGAAFAKSYAFFEKTEALEWSETTSYPKVFKLRGGAGSANVRLVKNKKEAGRLIKKAFEKGFKSFDGWASFKESIRKYRVGICSITTIFKSIYRVFFPPAFSRVLGRQIGYVFFQDFVPNNNHDIRVVVIGRKAFAIKRLIRKNDFRASGSGQILYEKNHFDNETISLAFQLAEKIKGQCIAFDFVYQNQMPLLVEISYGFAPEGYDACPGYWDKNLNWHPGKFDPYGWMVDLVLQENNE